MSGMMQLPLIRHFSRPMTALLMRTPATANQVTAVSLACGLAAAWYATHGMHRSAIVAGIWLLLCYVFDNCDGEIARLKNQCSSFGMRFDSFVD